MTRAGVSATGPPAVVWIQLNFFSAPHPEARFTNYLESEPNFQRASSKNNGAGVKKEPVSQPPTSTIFYCPFHQRVRAPETIGGLFVIRATVPTSPGYRRGESRL